MTQPCLPTAFRVGARATLSSEDYSEEPDDCTTYGRDWTRVHLPRAAAVAFPRTVGQVAELLALADTHGVGVVPSGGRTGLAGGAMATQGELVLSLSRMRRLHPVDVLGGTVRVEAGAVTEEVHQHAAHVGLTWPVDFASKGSSQVGGNIATNAGGVRVIRYGLTRQWVLGLEVVLPDGRILELNGALEKNNTGVDLRQLFIGSEGILGVVTAATLKLTPLPAPATVAVFALSNMTGVLSLFRAARQAPFILNAFEFFTAACVARVERHLHLGPPFSQRHAYYVLLECEGELPLAWAEEVLTSGIVDDAVIAQHAGQARELWRLRESISESLSATGLPHKNDIALPIAALGAFCASLEEVFEARYPDWEVCLFGHIGDGNLHVNVMKPEAMLAERFHAQTAETDHVLFELVQTHGGSISAEHGIGLLKKAYLAYSRGEAELSLMRSLKRSLDPKGTLNPGKVLDP